MKPSNLSFVPLSQASLCLDCEMITAAATCCAACGSSALMNMARTLSQPGHSRRVVTHNVNSTYTKYAERQTIFARQKRISASDYGLVCLQGGVKL